MTYTEVLCICKQAKLLPADMPIPDQIGDNIEEGTQIETPSRGSTSNNTPVTVPTAPAPPRPAKPTPTDTAKSKSIDNRELSENNPYAKAQFEPVYVTTLDQHSREKRIPLRSKGGKLIYRMTVKDPITGRVSTIETTASKAPGMKRVLEDSWERDLRKMQQTPPDHTFSENLIPSSNASSPGNIARERRIAAQNTGDISKGNPFKSDPYYNDSKEYKQYLWKRYQELPDPPRATLDGWDFNWRGRQHRAVDNWLIEHGFPQQRLDNINRTYLPHYYNENTPTYIPSYEDDKRGLI